jgi:peptidoglycan/xylan/chitin deacetylase (PgdA/CDA1 family)
MMRKYLLLFVLFPFLACSGGKTEGPTNGTKGSGNGQQSKVNDKKQEGPIVRCFAYHRFGNDEYPSTNISLDRFEAHLEYLKSNDFRVVTLGKALELLGSEKSFSRKIAVLTMDDGYRSIKTGAQPLLEEYGYPATVFACTEYVGAKNNLSWKDLKMLEEKGWEIGNHSHSHAHFLNAADGKVKEGFRKDLEKSEKIFKEHLGYEPELYAYPYGEYDANMKEVLKDKGYRAGLAQRSGVIHESSDRFNLPRFPMTSFYGKPEKFKEKAGMYPIRVLSADPESPVLESQTPPELTLKVQKRDLNPNGFQCFVDGDDACSMEVTEKEDHIRIRVQSEKKLTDRRTLYTITAPDRSGENWHWYSHLWVRPEKGE